MASWRAGVPDGPLSAVGLGTIAAVVVIDQASKALAETRLPFDEAIRVLPIISLLRVHNSGIAWSMLAGSGTILNVLALVVSAIVITLWVRSRDGGRLATVGFALIIGGAVGNLVDRLRFGYVVDFLLLHLGEWTLFVFNLADAALTLGPALLVIIYLWPPARS